MTSPALYSRQSIICARASRSSASSNSKIGTSPIMVTVVDIVDTFFSAASNSRAGHCLHPVGTLAVMGIIPRSRLDDVKEEYLSACGPGRLIVSGIKNDVAAEPLAFTLRYQ